MSNNKQIVNNNRITALEPCLPQGDEWQTTNDTTNYITKPGDKTKHKTKVS